MAERGMDCTLTIGGVTVGKITDFDPTYSKEEIDITTRASSGNKEVVGGIRSWTASGDSLWVPTDTGLLALASAYANDDPVACVWMDADSYGRSGSALLTEFHPGPQGLNDAVMCSFALVGSGAVTTITAGT